MSARVVGFWNSLALAALLFGLGAPAHAAITKLVTPNLSAGNGDFLVCRLTNLGANAITVKFQIVDLGGSVVAEEDRTVDKDDLVTRAGAESAACRFIGTFTKALVRTSIDVLSATGSTIAIAPAQ